MKYALCCTDDNCNNAGRTVCKDEGNGHLEQCCTTAMHVGVSFLISFLGVLYHNSIAASASIFAKCSSYARAQVRLVVSI